MTNLAARHLRTGQNIIERDEKGRVVRGFPVKVTAILPGCANHTHVQTSRGSDWCYDNAAIVEVER